MNLRFAQSEKKQQGRTFNTVLNLLARRLGVALFLAGADDWVLRDLRGLIWSFGKTHILCTRIRGIGKSPFETPQTPRLLA